MRPVVVTAVLLLVVLMSMSASAAWNPGEMCRTNYPATACRVDVGEGWYQFGEQRCVKAFHRPLLSYWDAEDVCRKFPNGHLVSIHSFVEVSQVECAMYRSYIGKPHYWIGLYRPSHVFWTNNTPEKQRYAWTDETNRDYFFWAPGEPNNENEKCMEMNFGDWGFWNDANCGEKKPYVCQVNI